MIPGNCYVKIPFKYFPLLKYNDTNQSTIFQGLIKVKLYTILKLGTPQQTVHIPIDANSNDFYITASPKFYFDQNPNYFQDLMFFEHNSSTTIKYLNKNELDGDNFFSSEYDSDIFEFNGKKIELEFYTSFDLIIPESGGIGMLLNPKSTYTSATPNETRSFLKKLKDHKLIDDYCWSIFYNSKTNYVKDEEGFLLLGIMPDEIDENLGYYSKNYFKKENFKNINADIYGNHILNRFFFDEIYVYDKNNEKLNITFDTKDLLQVELNFNNGGIRVPKNVFTYFENEIFVGFISKNECFKEIAIVPESKYNFFYCKNNKDIISQVKNKIPTFKFKSINLFTTFEINSDDLFYQQGDFVYCLIYSESTIGWSLGKPFLKKYQFLFNPNSKIIGFYVNTDNIKKDSSGSLTTFITVIIIVVVIIIAISLVVCKILTDKYKRKKKANELTDDDFDYTQKEENPNNLGIS